MTGLAAFGLVVVAHMIEPRSVAVAVLGATGVAGQQFVRALAHHPWFRIAALAASGRSAGRPYRDCLVQTGLFDGLSLPKEVLDLPVLDATDLVQRVASKPATGTPILDAVFSGLPTEAARTLEPLFAQHVPVFSTASAFRYEPDVPILVPGVNLDHAHLLALQRQRRGTAGFLAPGPNCTTTGLVICLKPLLDAFGLQAVIMTSLQAVSGAGRSPGVLALDILDNVVPYIHNEEEKVERETRKILGQLNLSSADPAGLVTPLSVGISCTCTRVPVLDGHTETVYVATRTPAPLPAVHEAFARAGRALSALGLPSMPASLIQVRDEPNRPQPRLDRDTGDGMTTVVGRLRSESVLGEHGVKFVLLSHNTRMGAAGGALLTAEWLLHQGIYGPRSAPGTTPHR